MGRQLTIRGVDAEVARRLEQLSRDRHQSVNATVIEILAEAVGTDGRRARLAQLATWTDGDLAEFNQALRGQRVIDAALWD